MNKPLSQIESRMIADWLRQEKNAHISNSFIFWRKRPANIVEWVKQDWNIKITVDDVRKAIGREDD